MSETAPTAEMANKVSTDLLTWFKWGKINLMDQDFACVKAEKHKIKKSTKSSDLPDKQDLKHTHPVDVVFHYVDPYLGKRIYFNTDLKSYQKGSIGASQVRTALQSLAKTIECAKVSKEWVERYNIFTDNFEIRALLFIYNHDNKYDKDFYKEFFHKEKGKTQKINTDSIPLAKNQQLHIIEPATINYMQTILTDISKLHMLGSFPEKNYNFFYPELHLHKSFGDKSDRPATIEMICGPFIIIEHGDVKKYCEDRGEIDTTGEKGVLIYYNGKGSHSNEFLYLLDMISKFQILDRGELIRVRAANSDYDPDILSKFESAVSQYIHGWGFDKEKEMKINSIQFDIVETTTNNFSKTAIGWK
ncbi:hypothetical protein ACU6U9_07410 [Pseudomonas sp. HK3]